MVTGSKVDIYKIALVALLLLAFGTRVSSLTTSIPKGSDPYLFGGAAVNLVNEWSIPAALPYGSQLTYAHLEAIFFLIFLVPFKLLFSDMKLVLKVVPGILAAINVLGIYLFVKALTKEKSIAIISAFFLVFNPFHSYTTRIATPEGLAFGLLFFSMYFFLENKILFAGITGGLILLTDYLVFGHFIIILTIYLLTNLNKGNAKHMMFVLFLTFLIGMPWQIYLNSISKASSFIGGVGPVQPQTLLVFSPRVVADTLYYLPTAITPLHAIFVVGGLYFARKREYFRFLSISLIPFLILSFANTSSLGAPPLRHVISLSVFSSIISAVFLDELKTRRLLFGLLILLSVLSYFSYPLDFFVEFPRETVDAANWLNAKTPQRASISAPSPAYAVFSGKTTVYENDPCNNEGIDYVVDDRNFEKWFMGYKGKTLEILDYSCLELVYNTKNVGVYEVTKEESEPR